MHLPQHSNVHPKGFAAARDHQDKGMSLFGSTDSKDSAKELWPSSFGEKGHSVPGPKQDHHLQKANKYQVTGHLCTCPLPSQHRNSQ